MNTSPRSPKSDPDVNICLEQTSADELGRIVLSQGSAPISESAFIPHTTSPPRKHPATTSRELLNQKFTDPII
ncbi:MAG: hypothetical protein R3C01_00345 [Planctomycetaceae bacterium]